MSPVGLERESADQELLLLIREARRRQRRRQTRRTLGVLVTAIVPVVAVLAVTGAYSPAAKLIDSGRPATPASGGCPTSPARFVANSTYSATVLGRGPVRLALGNAYLKARRRVVLGRTETPAWSAIEVIWVVKSSYRGSLVVRGSRLRKPGAIDVQSSNGSGQSPGSDTLTLSPSSANTMPRSRLYPGAIWVRSAGCYAVMISGRGIHERLVLDAQAHQPEGRAA